MVLFKKEGKINIPTNLISLGLNKEESFSCLEKACLFACNPSSEIHYLPFPVNQTELLKAILDTHHSGLEKVSIKPLRRV